LLAYRWAFWAPRSMASPFSFSRSSLQTSSTHVRRGARAEHRQQNQRHASAFCTHTAAGISSYFEIAMFKLTQVCLHHFSPFLDLSFGC
jgi:hypothetical protein